MRIVDIYVWGNLIAHVSVDKGLDYGPHSKLNLCLWIPKTKKGLEVQSSLVQTQMVAMDSSLPHLSKLFCLSS